MKKKALMSLVLLIVIGTSAVFAQSQGKYNLEIYNISEATYNTLERLANDPKQTREEDYLLVRTTNTTALRSKDLGLSFDQVKQKLQSIDSNTNSQLRKGIDGLMQDAQQRWGFQAWAYSTGSAAYRVYIWIRRQE